MARKVASSKGAKAKADRLFSLIIRSHGECENPACGHRCSCPEFPRRHTSDCRLQCAHIISRRFSSTRTDERNALCLCAGCHHATTDDPVMWVRMVDEVQGLGVYDELRADAEGVVKMDWPAEVKRLERIARERGVL